MTFFVSVPELVQVQGVDVTGLEPAGALGLQVDGGIAVARGAAAAATRGGGARGIDGSGRGKAFVTLEQDRHYFKDLQSRREITLMTCRARERFTLNYTSTSKKILG